jgi:uncharacterized protein
VGAAGPAHALALPARPDGPINDYAHVLGEGGQQRLTQQLLSYEQGTTRQIAVAIFPSLEEESLEDFSIRLAEAWKVGSKKNADGVLITLFMKEHKLRIEVGYGLEDRLTDAKTRQIEAELMEPRFKAGDFEGGLRAGLAAIDTATGGHEHPEGKLPARRGRDGGGFPVGLIVFGVIFLVAMVMARRGGGGRGGGGGGGGGFLSGLILGSLFSGSSRGWSGGSGGWSSGGGGGWSGGGGSFGGGGASGSW